MKRNIISILIICIFISLLSLYPNNSLASTEPQKVQLNVLVHEEDDNYTQIVDAYTLDDFILISAKELMNFTASSIHVDETNQSFTIEKGTKIIQGSKDKADITIFIRYPQTTDVLEYTLPTPVVEIKGSYYFPVEDLLLWLDSTYKAGDAGRLLISVNDITLLDYINSKQYLQEYEDVIFDFGNKIGMSAQEFYDLACASDICENLYNGVSLDPYRMFKNLKRFGGIFTNENTALTDYYSDVFKLMMTPSENEAGYAAKMELENTAKAIEAYTFLLNSISFNTNVRELVARDDLYSFIENIDNLFSKSNVNKLDLKDALLNDIVENTIRKGNIIPNSYSKFDYMKKINQYFDIDRASKAIDVAQNIWTPISIGLNAVSSALQHLNRNGEKLRFIDDAFTASPNFKLYPKELQKAATNETKEYDKTFSVLCEGFVGGTKDGAIFDLMAMFAKKGSKIDSYLSTIAAYQMIWSVWNIFDVAGVKSAQDSITSVLQTLSAYYIQGNSINELLRRYDDWNEDYKNMDKLDSLRSPLMTSLYASQIAYQCMYKYYDIDFLKQSNAKEMIGKLEEKVQKVVEIMSLINRLPLPTIKVSNIERISIDNYLIMNEDEKNDNSSNKPDDNFINSSGNGELTLHTGDYVAFGKYNDQPILWKVIKIDDGRPLLWSVYSLCFKSFDDNSNLWDTSKLRQWLNSSQGIDPYYNEVGFLSGFTPEEISAIANTVNTFTDDNGETTTTEDKVFLPSNKWVPSFNDTKITTRQNKIINFYWLMPVDNVGSYTSIAMYDWDTYYFTPRSSKGVNGAGGIVPALYLKPGYTIINGSGKMENPKLVNLQHITEVSDNRSEKEPVMLHSDEDEKEDKKIECKLVREIESDANIIGFSPDGLMYIAEEMDGEKANVQFYNSLTDSLEKQISYQSSFFSSGLGRNYNIRWNQEGNKFLFSSPLDGFRALSNFSPTDVYMCNLDNNEITGLTAETYTKDNYVSAFPAFINDDSIAYYSFDPQVTKQRIDMGIYNLNLSTGKKELYIRTDTKATWDVEIFNNDIIYVQDYLNDKKHGSELISYNQSTKEKKLIYRVNNGMIRIIDVKDNRFAVLENEQKVLIFNKTYDYYDLKHNNSDDFVVYNAAVSNNDNLIVYACYNKLKEKQVIFKNGTNIYVLYSDEINIKQGNEPLGNIGLFPNPMNNFVQGLMLTDNYLFIQYSGDKYKMYEIK